MTICTRDATAAAADIASRRLGERIAIVTVEGPVEPSVVAALELELIQHIAEGRDEFVLALTRAWSIPQTAANRFAELRFQLDGACTLVIAADGHSALSDGGLSMRHRIRPTCEEALSELLRDPVGRRTKPPTGLLQR